MEYDPDEPPMELAVTWSWGVGRFWHSQPSPSSWQRLSAGHSMHVLPVHIIIIIVIIKRRTDSGSSYPVSDIAPNHVLNHVLLPPLTPRYPAWKNLPHTSLPIKGTPCRQRTFLPLPLRVALQAQLLLL
jgi:hypothetical protein